ncbi:HU family DNA-binding protein [Neisseriaceae bacterium B1]
MIQSELIRQIAKHSGANQGTTRKVLESMKHVIKTALANGESVKLENFGSFTTHQMAERQGFNPLTKKPQTYPAHTRIKFKAGQSLKKRVNE